MPLCNRIMLTAIRRATKSGVYSFAEPVLGIFFRARVARQPQTTNTIKTARKIPSCSLSTNAFSPSPCMGWLQVLRRSSRSLAVFTAMRLPLLTQKGPFGCSALSEPRGQFRKSDIGANAMKTGARAVGGNDDDVGGAGRAQRARRWSTIDRQIRITDMRPPRSPLLLPTRAREALMMAGAGGAMRATGWRATAIRPRSPLLLPTRAREALMMAGAGGAMRATGWRATAIRFQQFGEGGPAVTILSPHSRARGG